MKDPKEVFVENGELDRNKVRGAILKWAREKEEKGLGTIPVNPDRNYKKAMVRNFESWIGDRVKHWKDFRNDYFDSGELYSIISEFYEANDEFREIMIEFVKPVAPTGKELGTIDEFDGPTVPENIEEKKEAEEKGENYNEYGKLSEAGIIQAGDLDHAKLKGTIIKFVNEVDKIKGTEEEATVTEVREAWARWMLDRVGGVWPKFMMNHVDVDLVETWIDSMMDNRDGFWMEVREKYEHAPEELEGNGNEMNTSMERSKKRSITGWNDDRISDSVDVDDSVRGSSNGDINEQTEDRDEDKDPIDISGSTVINGDSVDVIERINGRPIDAIICDPPFGQDYDNRTGEYGVIEGDSDVRGAMNMVEEVMKKSRMILARPAPVMFFCGEMNLAHTKSLVEKWFDFKQILIWDKDWIGMSNADEKWRPKKEFIVYGWYGEPDVENEHRHDGDILTFQRPDGDDRQHPTQKPVDLMQYLVEAVTEESDMVMDPFSGSGATLLGARRCGRDYVGIELDERYYEVIEDRLSQNTITSWG